MKLLRLTSLLLGLALAVAAPLFGQPRRKVIVDEDCLGPATTNLQTVLMFIQSPEVETLGSRS